jgi:diacylglycerol kinase (ATP)
MTGRWRGRDGEERGQHGVDPASENTSMSGGGPPGSAPRRGPWRLGVISNPLSGSNKRHGLGTVRHFLAEHPGILHREARSAVEVAVVLRDFAHADVNLIAVNSGDGTVQAVLTSLFAEQVFRPLPLLALLCGGTTNMTSQDLGLTGSRIGALRRLIAWAHHGDGDAVILRRAVLKVENSSHPGPLYGMFFGAGCITQGIEFFHSRVQKLGLSVGPAHLLIFARFLLGLARREDALVAPVSAAIRADRADMAKGDYLLMLISTLDRLILGLRPFWAQDDNPLHLTAVSAGFRHLFRGALPAMAQGHRNRYTSPENGYVSVNAREIRLDMDGAFAIDGELFRADRKRGPLVIQEAGPADFLRL